jgi:hypothetical protein
VLGGFPSGATPDELGTAGVHASIAALAAADLVTVTDRDGRPLVELRPAVREIVADSCR